MHSATGLLVRIGLTTLLATCVFTAGCAQPKPAVRFVHAAPRAGAVDVYVSGEPAPAFRNVRYGETTGYKPVGAGTHRIEVRPSGAPYSAVPAFVTETRRYDHRKRYTAIGAGLFETSNPEARFRVLNYLEEFGGSVSGRERVRFVHASADVPPVDVRLAQRDVKEVNDLKRFQASGAGGELVPADESLMFTYLTAESHQTIATFTTSPVSPRTEWFAVLAGLANEPPGSPYALTLLMVGPSGGVVGAAAPIVAGLVAPVVSVTPPPPPVMYLLNGSADAPALDIYMGSTPVASNLVFGGLVGSIQVPGGVQALDLFVHTEGGGRPGATPLATLRTTDLVSGQQYLAVIAGNLTPRVAQPPLQLVVYASAFSTSRTPVLRLVNALVGAPPLQTGVVQNGSFLTPGSIGPVAFAGASQAAGSAFPVGPVQVGFAPVGAVSPVATFVVNADPGMQAFLVPIGAMSPASGERPLRLAVVSVTSSPWTVAVLEPQ